MTTEVKRNALIVNVLEQAVSSPGKISWLSGLFLYLLLTGIPGFGQEVEEDLKHSVDAISSDDSLQILQHLNSVYHSYTSSKDEPEFLDLFYDSTYTYIREDFHATDFLDKPKISPSEYFRKSKYLKTFFEVTESAEEVNWEGAVWYQKRHFYTYFTFKQSVVEYDFIKGKRIEKSNDYEKMVTLEISRNKRNGEFDRAKILSVDALNTDLTYLYDSIRLHTDPIKREIKFANSNDSWINLEQDDLPHTIVLATNITDPKATFSLFARYRNSANQLKIVPIVSNVGATMTEDSTKTLRSVVFKVDQFPPSLLALNRKYQNQGYRLMVRYDQNPTIRETSEEIYYFTRFMNFEQVSMRDIYQQKEIVPKLSDIKSAQPKQEGYCYAASSRRDGEYFETSKRGRKPQLVYQVHFFVDPENSFFDKNEALVLNGKVSLLESFSPEGPFEPVSSTYLPNFKEIYKMSPGNGEIYKEGRFEVNKNQLSPPIYFDLNPLVKAVESLPEERYPDSHYAFQVSLKNDSIGFEKTIRSAPFQFRSPIRVPTDYGFFDRFFSSERKLLIRKREEEFDKRQSAFDRDRKTVTISSAPTKNIADYDRGVNFTLKVKNLSQKDTLQLMACSKKTCFQLREITLSNKEADSYEMVVPLFDHRYPNVESYGAQVRRFLFDREVYFKVQKKNARRIAMPYLGYRGEHYIYANNCRDNSYARPSFEKTWNEWATSNPSKMLEVLPDSTSGDYRVFPWLEVLETDAELSENLQDNRRKTDRSLPFRVNLAFPRDNQLGKRIGIMADVSYQNGFLKNVMLDTLTVTEDKMTFRIDLIEKYKQLNIGEYFNSNIYFFEVGETVFNANPKEMKWGKRKELLLRNTRFR